MTTTPLACEFCPQPALVGGKCYQHRYRQRCKVLHCTNQTYARNLCVQHGGKTQCRFDGCQGNARRFGFCCKHSPTTRKLCCEDGCDSIAHARGRCARHGGGRTCLWEGCAMYARCEGFCQRHFRSIQVAAPQSVDPDVKFSKDELDMLSFFMKDSDAPWIEDIAVDKQLVPMYSWHDDVNAVIELDVVLADL
ncbi:Aste57867_11411 [Aphanomyces stellatus]|uniref:Aste57867_11411 protein n=1 Tax=Aphanomyces stellatus TaxID=120398 RepID=A0A485KTI4_9STRA|nr:hypothetical protein As57867_011369 [Aphanomyces stellatus]VFT88272.1 Aste57867_11411 [Aphanomyces stellatus]